jgi:Zn-dependent peptidase ImmA (M78 family)
MPPVRIQVKPDIIDWALTRSGHSVELLEKFPGIPLWKSGERLPTINQLEKFASASYTPFGYFFLDSAPVDKLPIPDFRTVADKEVTRPSPNLIDTVHMMERRQEWLSEYLQSQGEPENDFVGWISGPTADTATIENYAQALREALGLRVDWAYECRNWTEALGFLRTNVEAKGVAVVSNGIVGNNTHRTLDPSEFRGFVLVDRYAPLVFLNGADSKSAQMFTLAHEIAHVCLGASAAFDLKNLDPADDQKEKFCNQLAAEFLVPRTQILSIWKDHTGSQYVDFEGLAQQFKVSQLVIARRASDLGLIPKELYYAFYKNYMSAEHIKASTTESTGGDFYRTQNQRIGRLFARTVLYAIDSGSLSYDEAYRLTGLSGATFHKFAEKMRETSEQG